MIQTIALSLLQGFTEFLPISSVAHLILVPKLVGWADQGLAFDISVHVGTLIAVLVYFRKEIYVMTVDWIGSLLGKGHTANSRLAWAVGLGTIPVGLAGFFGKRIVETTLRSALVITTTTMVFGLLLGFAAWIAKSKRGEDRINWKDILMVGTFQVLALIPGTSRSGITITAGLLRGLTPQAATRYSFLLSIPVILSAGGLNTVELLQTKTLVDWQALMIGTLISGLSAYICIYAFLKLLDRAGFMPFVVYRLFLGGFLFWMFF